MTTPASRAAAAVTILKVEPGGYVSRSARLSIGRAGSSFSAVQAVFALVPVPESTDGSYEGLLTSARILPVAGSRAATAPRLPPSPAYAARCTAARTVMAAFPPAGRPRARSYQSGNADSPGSVPDRTASSARSTKLVPYVWEEKPVTGA